MATLNQLRVTDRSAVYGEHDVITPIRVDAAIDLLTRIENVEASIGIVGLGYVGLPLARVFWDQGYRITGFDIDPQKVERLSRGDSYIKSFPSSTVAALNESRRFAATTDFSELARMDAILICVPTPLGKCRDPDLSYVVETSESIARRLRPGQLIVLESTTYPGTTVDVVKPILERRGLKSGVDFYLAYSPEREDPGNPVFETAQIPKVVGGDGTVALQLAEALYAKAVVQTVSVSSTQTAEAVKLTENIFRSVNIALVNELKLVFEAMGVDVWEVIEAAKTKPFGFMPFYPGPGLGGHCIPIDPFYLSWRAKRSNVETRIIELAGDINASMPRYVVERVSKEIVSRYNRKLTQSRILLLGLAYKKNVDDTRESPGLKIMELLQLRGAAVDYHDPYIPRIPVTRKHPRLAGKRSVPWTAEAISDYDAVLICTDHDELDYGLLGRSARLIVDTRNVMVREGFAGSSKVIKA